MRKILHVQRTTEEREIYPIGTIFEEVVRDNRGRRVSLLELLKDCKGPVRIFMESER